MIVVDVDHNISQGEDTREEDVDSEEELGIWMNQPSPLLNLLLQEIRRGLAFRNRRRSEQLAATVQVMILKRRSWAIEGILAYWAASRQTSFGAEGISLGVEYIGWEDLQKAVKLKFKFSVRKTKSVQGQRGEGGGRGDQERGQRQKKKGEQKSESQREPVINKRPVFIISERYQKD